jgi:type IV pilus assembly protein PilQ
MAAALTTALAGAALVAAGGTPVRLVGVTAHESAVVIEATEPAAYTVTRPDPLTLVVDLRDASVADAPTSVPPRGLVSGVRLEQATAPDGVGVARVRIALGRAAEYTVRSARNTIRLELQTGAPAAAAAARPVSAPAVDEVEAAKPVDPVADVAIPGIVQTNIERIRTTRRGGSTIVTISADGPLKPAGITESRDLPRRLMLDFADVGSRAVEQSAGDGDLVRRVRVSPGQASRTRVVMEIAEAATYTVQKTPTPGRELSVVFMRPKATGTSLRSLRAGAAGPQSAPPGTEVMSLEQAIANGRSLAPNDGPGVEAISALSTVPQGETQAARATSSPVAPPATRAPAANILARPAPAAMQQAAPPVPLQSGPAAPAPAVAGAAPVTSPVLQGPQSQQITNGQEKKYTGHPVSMDFQGVDLRSVLRTFAEISGLNMVIDPDVQGTVDIVLTDVPWDQALEVILRGNSLDYTVDGSIVRIARVETIRKEQDARTLLAQSAANAGALAVRTYTLSYAKADQAAPLIKSSVLSPRGNVQIDARTNTLIITDLPARLDTVAQLLTTLDRAEPQVEIEARIITTTREFAKALGVQWGFNGRVTPDVGNTTNLTFPNNGTLGGRVGGLQGPGGTDPRAGANDSAGTAVNLGVPTATSAVGLALGSINGAFNLDVALSALERTGKGRILSTPRVTTQNNVEAEITQGVQIPVQTEANNTVTVTFKDAALTLKVTPQITAAGTVIMQITLENATPGVLVNDIPSIDTQRAITRVQVSDGMTTVMGGIFVSREQTTNEKTPVLYRIPFLGWLFKRDSQVDESRELLIFITPRIQKG